MRSSVCESQLEDKPLPELSSQGVERRKLQRREQSDRREIERFGFKIVSRRSGSDRRESQNSGKGYE